MNIIVFIVRSAEIRQMLDHIGAQSEPPNISPAREPPISEDFDAQLDEHAQVEPEWDLAAQPAAENEANQRLNW
jgi:hypothetical protein